MSVKSQVVDYIALHPAATAKEVADALTLPNVKTVAFYLNEIRTATGEPKAPRAQRHVTPADVLRVRLETLKAQDTGLEAYHAERKAIGKALLAVKDYPLACRALEAREAACAAAIGNAQAIKDEMRKLEAAIAIFEPSPSVPEPATKA